MKFKFKKVTCLTPDPPPGVFLPVFGVADLAEGVFAGFLATGVGFAGVPTALKANINIHNIFA